MSYIKSHKEQNWLLPPSIEDLIPKDHVCYLVEGLVESLDYTGFDVKYEGAGHPAYHPTVILKLLVMGVIDKVRSSRRLARSARENVVYMYLAEKLMPDFRTISDFRKENPAIVKAVFKHTVMLAKQQGLIDLSNFSTDGTKVKANASSKRVLTKDELSFLISFVDNELKKWAEQDEKEDEVFGDLRGSDQLPDGSKKKMQKAVKDYVRKFRKKGDIFKKEVKTSLSRARDEVEKNQLKKASVTDPESRFMGKKGKIELSYNSQVTVDKKGFILANDVCQDAVDKQQLRPQFLQTEENLGSIPEGVGWNFDNGYFSGENLAFLERKNVDAYIPDLQLAQKDKGKQPRETFQESLTYDMKKDTFITPVGEVFVFLGEYFDRSKGLAKKDYVLRRDGKVVKTIHVYPYHVQRRNMADKMRTLQALEAYKLRQQTVEPVFGDIKENKGLRSFLTRSIQTVRTEFNLACIGHNIQKLNSYQSKKLQRVLDQFLSFVKLPVM